MPDRVAQSGFSLIEVTVALAVFALAAMALLEVQTASVRNAAALEERLLARIVAENRMALRRVFGASGGGVTGGGEEIAGRTMLWRERTIVTDDPDILRIEIDVRSGEGGQILATLTGFAGAQ